jgi:hypothetical protein
MDYFDSIGIKYQLGADYVDEDYNVIFNGAELMFLHTYVVLLEEDDFSAIQLSLDHVKVIENRTYYKFLNFFRRKLKCISS